jgi:pyrroloquinoline quinone (PQQ) biosynthesis protein C
LERTERIFQQIRKTLKPIEGKLFEHPFLKKVEDKVYSKEQMSLMPKEEYYIVASDLLSSRHLLGRFGDAPSGPFFKSLVENEEFAQRNIVMLAEALGCSRAQLDEYEPDPLCQAYPSYFARLALHGSEAEVLVAFASNFSVWWSACKRVATALELRYGVPKEATAFLNPFNEVPPPDAPFDELTVDALTRGLAGGVQERDIIRVARIIQQYELLFWDALERSADSLV